MPLKELLNQNRIMQLWGAENLRVPEITISSWCKVKSKPIQKLLLRLSSVLKVSGQTIHSYL